MNKKQKLAALSLCGLSLALLPFVVFADAPEGALKPFLWFDVASRLPEGLRERSLVVKRIVARPGQLYFRILVGPSAAGDNPGGFVIRTDEQGNFQSMMGMPVGTLDPMGVDDSGRLFVLKVIAHERQMHQSQMMIYSPEGQLLSMDSLPVPPAEFSVRGGDVAGISRDGFVFRVSATPQQPFPPEKHQVKTFAKGEEDYWVPLIASLPAGRFVVAEGLECLIYLGSLSKGVDRSFRPNVPYVNEKYHEYLLEYEESKVLNAGRRGPAPRAVLYKSLASDEIGDIFIGTSGYLPREGAIVIQFDKDGTYKRTLRCSLPTFPDLQSDLNDPFQGHMLLSEIAVSSGLLYVSDHRGMVAVYKLD